MRQPSLAAKVPAAAPVPVVASVEVAGVALVIAGAAAHRQRA